MKTFKFENVPPVRTKTMRAIKSQGNKSTELRLRLALARAGIKGWRLHYPGLLGKPDFYFPDIHLAIFVDGCFWHGCADCKIGHTPKTNQIYWSPKIQRNKDRDALYTLKLQQEGIQVLRFWEHELKQNTSACISKIKNTISSLSQEVPIAIENH